LKKYFILCLTFALSLTLASIAVAKDYNYISPQELKIRLDAGEIEKGTMVMFSTQTEKEYATGYLPTAIQTFARPLESETDFRKLDPVLAKVKDTTEDIIIICPRGGSGATRPFDYFKQNGINPDRLLVLTKGQEAYNKAFPMDVFKP
jgi:thiosulfate/3-mercaptopyruvate sulfurtransferase